MDIPYTLDEATSSNDIMFMERLVLAVIAANLVAGDFRSFRRRSGTMTALGRRLHHRPGDRHDPLRLERRASRHHEQYGADARVAGNPISGKDYSVHIGADAQWLIQPPSNLIAGTQAVTAFDRPELRIDPTSII